MWYAMVGDEAGMREAFRNSFQLGNEEGNRANFAGSLAILGFFSEAQDQLRPILLAESGFLHENLDRGARLGLFQLIAEQLALAKERNMQTSPHTADIDAITVASHVMRQAGLSDADIADQLDLMGLILRRHQIPTPGISYRAVDEPAFRGIVMQAHIAVDPATVFALNVELAELMQERGIPVHESLSVIFGGALQ
jgi:hypothetical protein